MADKYRFGPTSVAVVAAAVAAAVVAAARGRFAASGVRFLFVSVRSCFGAGWVLAGWWMAACLAGWLVCVCGWVGAGWPLLRVCSHMNCPNEATSSAATPKMRYSRPWCTLNFCWSRTCACRERSVQEERARARARARGRGRAGAGAGAGGRERWGQGA